MILTSCYSCTYVIPSRTVLSDLWIQSDTIEIGVSGFECCYRNSLLSALLSLGLFTLREISYYVVRTPKQTYRDTHEERIWSLHTTTSTNLQTTCQQFWKLIFQLQSFRWLQPWLMFWWQHTASWLTFDYNFMRPQAIIIPLSFSQILYP